MAPLLIEACARRPTRMAISGMVLDARVAALFACRTAIPSSLCLPHAACRRAAAYLRWLVPPAVSIEHEHCTGDSPNSEPVRKSSRGRARRHARLSEEAVRSSAAVPSECGCIVGSMPWPRAGRVSIGQTSGTGVATARATGAPASGGCPTIGRATGTEFRSPLGTPTGIAIPCTTALFPRGPIGTPCTVGTALLDAERGPLCTRAEFITSCRRLINMQITIMMLRKRNKDQTRLDRRIFSSSSSSRSTSLLLYPVTTRPLSRTSVHKIR